MAIERWSDEIIIVDLPDEPEIADELISLSDLLAEKENCNVVIDLGGVGDISSDNLSKLLKLHQMIAEAGRRFVLCNIEPATQDIFAATGLSGVFDLSENRFDALATLEMIG